MPDRETFVFMKENCEFIEEFRVLPWWKKRIFKWLTGRWTPPNPNVLKDGFVKRIIDLNAATYEEIR